MNLQVSPRESANVRHVLFIAFHFPPEASSSGVLRTLKYARYLPEFAWRVSVVAPEEAAYSLTDERLVKQVPSSCRVIRTKFLNSKRDFSIAGRYPQIFALPDPWIGWFPWAVAAGRKLMAEDAVDLVYSTSPHATAHLIAWRLAATLDRPWVADFRDPWFEDPPDPDDPDGPIFRCMTRFLEAKVVSRATRVVTSTEHLCRTLRSRYPAQGSNKFVVIPNGYDEADFTGLPPPTGPSNGRFVIVHAGILQARYRDPRPLMRALRAAADAKALRVEDIRLRFIGPGPFAQSPELREAIDELRLTQTVEFVPRLPYEAALAELARADLLLLLQASPDTASLVPAKLYEYLRAEKPTLAMVHPGAVDDVMALTGGGWALPPSEETRLREFLGTVYQRWKSGTLHETRADLGVLRRFDRRALANQLAKVFRDVVASHQSGCLPAIERTR